MNMSISFKKSDQQVSLSKKSHDDLNVNKENEDIIVDSDGRIAEELNPEQKSINSLTEEDMVEAEEAIEHQPDLISDLDKSPEAEHFVVDDKIELPEAVLTQVEPVGPPVIVPTPEINVQSNREQNILMSPLFIVSLLFAVLLVTKVSVDFMLGVLSTLIVTPVVIYLVIKFYFFNEAVSAESDQNGKRSDTTIRTETEMSGWLFIKETKGERKSAYATLLYKKLKLSYKDSTIKTIEFDETSKLNLLSPYTKNKKRLKHLWTKNLPIVITTETERVVLYFREAKQKETWFWALYTMFYSYDDLQLIYGTKDEKSDTKDWINLLLDRIFRDFLKHPRWCRWIRRKCEQKLRKLPLPKFIDRVKVRRVVLGQQFPKLSSPSGHLDADGQAQFSFDLDASNSDPEASVFEMTLETRLNASFFTHFREDDKVLNPDLAGLSDDDDEDDEVSFDTISSSSEDEDEPFEHLPLDAETASVNDDKDSIASTSDKELVDTVPMTPQVALPGKPESTPRSLLDKLRVKGSVLLNKNKTVRKLFDDLVSSSQLTVTVRVMSLRGTLLLSQPTWPSDRLWFKMGPKPDLKLSVHLQHGTAGKPLIKSTMLKNLLEDRLRQHLVTVLCTYDDVSFHPLLLLPSPMFYALRNSTLPSTLFTEKL
ncbi:hypothetical protein HDE_05964 [Halotydeus destructor]|nr:hypothetical protein HDE_05964 [Halotydeus destructor]